MNSFESGTQAYIDRLHLLHRKAPVIVALSGGADSVALLAVLSALGYDCRAAHCNFHLRGEESMRDMRHAQSICGLLDIDLYVRDFDVAARVERTGESLEMACRELRYAWFADLLDREGAQAIAVGHHREDRAETFMLNLMRGAGITGLISMRPRSGSVVRPLLQFDRAEIEAYLAGRGLSFVDDSSNKSDAHRRNRLRNSIFPLMEELFPGAMEAVLRTVGNLESAHVLYREAIEAKRARYCHKGSIDLAALAGEAAAETLLMEFLRDMGFSFTQTCSMLAAAQSSGQKFISSDGKILAEINRGRLDISDASHLTKAGEGTVCVDLRHDVVAPVHITVSRGAVENFFVEGLGPSVAYLDAAVLEGNPVFELRHWQRGDRMVPFGSKRSKLVSDIFADARLTAQQKRTAWILTRNGEIIWIPGIRNSAAASVGPETKHYIRLQIIS